MFCCKRCVLSSGNLKQTHWDYERATQKGRYRNPVEREQTHSETTDGTKKAVHHDVIRSNPANPIEYAQSRP